MELFFCVPCPRGRMRPLSQLPMMWVLVTHIEGFNADSKQTELKSLNIRKQFGYFGRNINRYHHIFYYTNSMMRNRCAKKRFSLEKEHYPNS